MNGELRDTWLVLETSGRTGAVALASGDGLLCEALLDGSRRHARDLAAMVADLLAAKALNARDLRGLVVSLGPGSYTGLRVGVISAKTLAYANGVPLIAVPTFAAIAEQMPEEVTSVGVIADALQGLIYRQRFVKRDGIWTAAEELRIEPLAGSQEWLQSAGTISGPGVSLLQKPGIAIAEESLRVPRCESLWRVAKRLQPATLEELFSLEPLYLRGSSAEEKAKREANTGVPR